MYRKSHSVRLVSLIGGAPGGSGNLSTSLSNVARLAAHPKFVWVFIAGGVGDVVECTASLIT
jgi:hypothetical protein